MDLKKALSLVTPERLKAIKEGVQETFKVDADSYDVRDIERFNEGDWYPSMFVQWRENIEEAVQLVKTTFIWRKQNEINDLTVEKIGEEAFKKGYVYPSGYDTDGHRVLYMKCDKLHKSTQMEQKLVLWYWLERLQQAEPGKKITFVMDVPGTTLFNVDNEFNKLILATYSEYYPGILSRTLIYEMPWLLDKVWQFMRYFFDEDIKENTLLVNKDEIRKYIDEDNLLTRMDGKNKFEYSFPFSDEIKALCGE